MKYTIPNSIPTVPRANQIPSPSTPRPDICNAGNAMNIIDNGSAAYKSRAKLVRHTVIRDLPVGPTYSSCWKSMHTPAHDRGTVSVCTDSIVTTERVGRTRRVTEARRG